MIYLQLFLGFLNVGFLAFGGAYGAIPLIRDVVMSHGWLTDEMLTYMIAVSESTPGSIVVNLSTYVGYSQAGILGALCATTAAVLPAFIIILLIAKFLKNAMKIKSVQAILYGLNPCVAGIILATGIYMVIENVFAISKGGAIGLKELVLTLLLGGVMFGGKKIFGKTVSPIALILIAAVLGIFIY